MAFADGKSKESALRWLSSALLTILLDEMKLIKFPFNKDFF